MGVSSTYTQVSEIKYEYFIRTDREQIKKLSYIFLFYSVTKITINLITS